MHVPKSLAWPNGQAVRWVVGVVAALLTIMCSYVLGRVSLVRSDLTHHERLPGHATVLADVAHLESVYDSLGAKLDRLTTKVETNNDQLIEQRVILQSIKTNLESHYREDGPH